jgi:hypothetical protein
MKIEFRRASPVIVAVLVGLLVVATAGIASGDGRSGGGVHANQVAQNSAFVVGASSLFARTSARRGGKFKLRFGKLQDTDTTAHDGLFNVARGHATCKRRERLISGGLRLHSGSASFIVGHFAMVESGPVPRLRQWVVTASSDLGGAARQSFLVVAYCRSR